MSQWEAHLLVLSWWFLHDVFWLMAPSLKIKEMRNDNIVLDCNSLYKVIEGICIVRYSSIYSSIYCEIWICLDIIIWNDILIFRK